MANTADRVQDSTASTASPFTLNGTPATGYRSFYVAFAAAAAANVPVLFSDTSGNWMVALCTYNGASPGTLTVNTIQSSSAGTIAAPTAPTFVGTVSVAVVLAAKSAPTANVDSNQNVIGLSGPNGLPMVSYRATVSASRNISASDFDTILQCASAVALTIPTDATLGITDTNNVYAPTINVYWYGATTPTIAAGSGVTLRGSARSISQYGVFSLFRSGANEWTYL